MWKLFLLSFCFWIFPFPAQAALDLNGVSITASVNKTSITLEDELSLTVTIEGAAGEIAPQLPSMPAFNVYQRSFVQQTNNFHITTTYQYVLLPRFPGKTTIGPITLNYGNKTYKTDPISVTVYRSPRQPAQTKTRNTTSTATQKKAKQYAQAPADMPALEKDLYNRAARLGHKDYFMVAAVSDKTPYANQTITLAVRFYYARPFMGTAPYTAPAINNLFMEEIGRSEGRQIIDGKTYIYTEIRYSLSGVTATEASIGPASIKYVPETRLNLSMFDKMFATMGQEPQTVQSNSISLQIRPVPTFAQPKSFYGAVGSGYTVSATVDREEVEAGDAINLTVKVNGPGNLKPTSDLKLPTIAGFKTYDVVSTSGMVPTNGELRSYKIFKTVLVPAASGTYSIPSLPWSFFDPDTHDYRTIYTEPISVKVTPSTQADAGFDFSNQQDLGNGFRQLGRDILYLKSNLNTDTDSFLSKIGKMNWLIYIALIALGLCGLFAFADKKTLAQKHALAKAKAQLKNAYHEEVISDTLSTYLQVRYQVNTGSLPLREISAALKQKSCPSALIERFEVLWQKLDAARFAPVDMQGEGTHELAAQALELIKDMDKESKK